MPLVTLPSSGIISYSLDATPANGPVVVLSNSLCAPFAAWDHVVAVLNQEGFRCLRYDQPGHGLSSSTSPPEATTFDSIADDAQFLLQSLSLTKVHGWIGVSMGAAIGVYFASKYPGVIGQLAIVDTISCSPLNAGIDDPFGPRVAAAREAGNMKAVLEGTLERWVGKKWIASNEQEASRMRNLMSGTSVEGFASCCAALRSHTFDMRPLFEKLGAAVEDVICIVGENDGNLPRTMETMRGQIEGGFEAAGKPKLIELKVIQKAGHVCFIDGFDQFMEIIVPFLHH